MRAVWMKGKFTSRESAARATAALVWVHGGAFIVGSLDQKEAHWPAIELASSGIPVFSVDYRPALNGVHYPTPQDGSSPPAGFRVGRSRRRMGRRDHP